MKKFFPQLQDASMFRDWTLALVQTNQIIFLKLQSRFITELTLSLLYNKTQNQSDVATGYKSKAD